MIVGLIDIEPKIFNTAYMQISQHHKQQGDIVEWWSPLTDSQFDMVYCSSLFDFTDKSEVPKRAICGGTGFDLTTKLPFDCEYDYSIYPKCKTSFVWFSKGCDRNCPWCVVPEKEGRIHSVEAKNLNPKGEYITIQDNSFFANPQWKETVHYLRWLNVPLDFQGIDVRRIKHFQAVELSELRHYKQIKIAWDNPKEEKAVLEGIARLTKHIKPYKIMCYVLIGYYDSPDLDLYRVEVLRKLGIDPFVMPYDRSDPYQKNFARWVNHKAIFKTVKWEDYKSATSVAKNRRVT